MTCSPDTGLEPDASVIVDPAATNEERLSRLRRKARDLPPSSGVYLMIDADSRIIYVGKAKILPRRVSGYFQKNLPPRVALMVSQIESFEFVVTNTEKEALILENNLIKKHRPRFNVILRDDKTYPSLRLNHHEPYPFLEIVRRPVKDGSIIYGPFPSVGALRETIRLANRLFPLRKCRRPEVKKVSRPCLNYQMGRCVGPCRPEMSQTEYQAIAERVRLFFRGESEKLTEDLTRAMVEAAERLDYEAAAKARDSLRDIKTTLERQVVAKVHGQDRDAWGLVVKDGVAQAAVLTIRAGVVTGCRPVWAEGEGAPNQILLSLLTQYYGQGHFVPQRIWLPEDLGSEREGLEDWLSALGQPVKIGEYRGEDGRRILAMAQENARVSLEERLEQSLKTQGAMVELKARLDLAIIPRRLECFDLAHLQGQATTAGMVVMEAGELKKEAYRRFKIKADVGGDDYAGLKEVLTRRFDPNKEPNKWPNPDLVVVDGGLGQLSAALLAFKELNIPPPPLVGIAKDRTGGGPDRIFKPNRKNPVDLRPGSAGLLVLAKLRDEAHRYCRSYHHLLRSKSQVESLFDGLKGIGPRRRQAILNKFVTLEAIAQATPSEILDVAHLPSETLLELRKRIEKRLASQVKSPKSLE
ncbi:MAG: excinuclease ABC subunit UvrC [Deltaproteobacteria bacterium]|jgi:excinuclease ABC subunit C|nr:excinuclease ABC subunit UvrC [Deltaproteobacteria bacterium]